MEVDLPCATDGWIRLISLPHPSLHDNTADYDRLKNHLKKQLKTESVEIDLSVLRGLPFQLRDWDYTARCIVVKERDVDLWHLIGILDPLGHQRVAGVAVDLGTSRVVIRLLDLATKENIYETSFDNPQLGVGADILTRVHACDLPNGLEGLNRMIIHELNQQIQDACQASGLHPP